MLFMLFPPILWPLLTASLLFPPPRRTTAEVIDLASRRAQRRGGAEVVPFPGDNAA